MKNVLMSAALFLLVNSALADADSVNVGKAEVNGRTAKLLFNFMSNNGFDLNEAGSTRSAYVNKVISCSYIVKDEVGEYSCVLLDPTVSLTDITTTSK